MKYFFAMLLGIFLGMLAACASPPPRPITAQSWWLPLADAQVILYCDENPDDCSPTIGM